MRGGATGRGRFGVLGRRRAPGLLAALVALGTAAGLTLVAPGVSGGAAGAKLAASGPADEGPYPWKYPASGAVTVGGGKTVAGTSCAAGTPQFPSPYADPCVAKFTGNNGGATSRGVTSTTITIAEREFPSTANAEQLASMAHQAGQALPSVTQQVTQVFLNYFNKVYDLYGRHVVLEPMTATGNATTEALNGGQAQACADAATITDQMHAFGEAGLPSDFQFPGTGPFSKCAASDHLVEFDGDLYFDEATFQSQNPYVWSVTQDCTRVSATVAEVEGTLLAGHKAIYAGDPALRSQTRKFGTYVPNVPQYLSCTRHSATLLEQKYHVPASQIAAPFTYDLDVSTFLQSAQQAVVQFKAAGVTTVVLACDPYSAGYITKEAAAQNYHPEFFIIGTALDDQDQFPQSQDDPAEIQGHLFGMSELSPANQVYGPDSLAGQLYRKLTGHEIPPGTDGNYPALVEMFDMLQAAGPDLTPQNMARGVHALPGLGAPSFQYGSWTYNLSPSGVAGKGDHTASNSARFIYWDGGATSPVNGDKGTYVSVFGGRRFALGQWPKSLPTLFSAPGAAATTT